MIDFDLAIEYDAEGWTITGGRDSVLVLLEAARRDLNAMAQAPGASVERKAAYGRLAGRLNVILKPLPRVNLLSGAVSSAEEIARRPLPTKAPDPVLTIEEIVFDDDDDDILG